MREIKFRVWDTNNKEILELEELNYEYGEPAIKTTMYNDYFKPSEMILMEYTGLKDKNRKEIYEGDIVQYSDIYNGVVEYSEKYAQFILKETGVVADECEALGEFNIKVFEVIGNIYENKNLLKEKSNE